MYRAQTLVAKDCSTCTHTRLHAQFAYLTNRMNRGLWPKKCRMKPITFIYTAQWLGRNNLKMVGWTFSPAQRKRTRGCGFDTDLVSHIWIDVFAESKPLGETGGIVLHQVEGLQGTEGNEQLFHLHRQTAHTSHQSSSPPSAVLFFWPLWRLLWLQLKSFIYSMHWHNKIIFCIMIGSS